jgi:hypothetical protein
LTQTATFRPKGLNGRLYWYAVSPLHHFIFEGMLRRIAGKAWGRVGLVIEGLGWYKGWVCDSSLLGSLPFFEGTLTATLIKVAFGLVSCQKKEPEQAAKRDMSFYPLWHGKSLTEPRTKIHELRTAQHHRRVAETAYPFTLDWND